MRLRPDDILNIMKNHINICHKIKNFLNKLFFMGVAQFNFTAFSRCGHQINFNQAEKAFRRFQHNRPLISDVSKLNSVAVFKVNQSTGVAWICSSDVVCCVWHGQALIFNAIVKFDTISVIILFIWINDLRSIFRDFYQFMSCSSFRSNLLVTVSQKLIAMQLRTSPERK